MTLQKIAATVAAIVVVAAVLVAAAAAAVVVVLVLVVLLKPEEFLTLFRLPYNDTRIHPNTKPPHIIDPLSPKGNLQGAL